MILEVPGNRLARPESSVDPQQELAWRCQSQPCSWRLPMGGGEERMPLTSCQSSLGASLGPAGCESEDQDSISELYR